MESTPLPGAAIRDLEAHLLGELIRPAHDDYAAARQVWNRAVDRHPALIVRAADAADVVRAVSFAREQGLPLAVRSGGHSMAGHGTVDGGLVLDLETGQRVVEPLRRLGRPIADIAGPMPYPAMFALTDQASRPEPSTVRSGYLGAFADDTLETIVEHAARMPVPFGLVQLRALGGAMARVPVEATAFAHRDKPFMATVVGSTSDPVDIDRQRAWTEELWSVLRPRSQGVYMNFLEDEGDARVREAYVPATYARLAAIERRYDPTDLFRLNQNIRPTG